MKLKGLYGITNTSLFSSRDKFYATISEALNAGMKILQYRDKTNNQLEKITYAVKLRQLCEDHKALFIINDDIQLALKVKADGVHLGRNDISISQARYSLGDQAIIGFSCSNSLQLAKEAIASGANYISFGKFFHSLTKPAAPDANVNTLVVAKKIFDVPICAIGGINTNNIDSILQYGVDMIAVSNGIFASKNVYNTTLSLVKKMALSNKKNICL